MRSWKRPVAAIAAAAILVDAFMVVTDTGPDVVLIAALCVLVGAALWFTSDLMNSTAEATELAAAPNLPLPPATDRRVMRLRSGLVYGRRDDTSLERLRATLVELVDDQLRAVYQIDRVEEPDRARVVLGDQLWRFVDDPRTAHELARPNQLDRTLTLIEQI